MTDNNAQAPADILQLALPRSQKVVLVMDLVESVRLMGADEAGTVARWHDFVSTAKDQAIPAHAGRLVKSLGDGLMAEFDEPRQAVNAALTLHSLLGKTNQGHSADLHMHLRAGINASHVYTDALDIYGAGVNLAARLATLAGPGETVVSANVRDGLTDGLDASVEDLGDCYLKHIDQPVRAYRVGEAGAAPVVVARANYEAVMQPTIAVIPFTSRSNEPEHFAVGELIADGVIAMLACAPDLRVISRLSSSAFRGRSEAGAEIVSHLKADYVLSGSYLARGSKLVITAELIEARRGLVVSSDRMESPLEDLFGLSSEAVDRIAQSAQNAILDTEAQRARVQPLPTLQSYSLLLGAVTMMHRTAKGDFFRAQELLKHLRERHQRQSVVPAWLAKWHVLQVEQGWAHDNRAAGLLALDESSRALDLDPDSSLALSMDGFVRCNLLKDFDGAEARYQKALAVNPNESLAWLFLGMLHAFRGEGAPALAAADKAIALSPLDPARYFYDSLSASIHLSAGQYEKAIGYAQRSLRGNATHVSTHRALTIAQVLAGQMEAAQQSARRLMQMDPGLTVGKYLARSPGVEFGIGKTFAEALRMAGVPA